MERTVGVVIPAYAPPVGALEDYVHAAVGIMDPDAIRIELDAPRPGTEERLEALPATVAVSQVRRGKGAAVSAGFDALDSDVLVMLDADGSTPVSGAIRLLEPIRTGDAAIAVGSRRHPDATVRGSQSMTRRYLGGGFAWCARRILEPSLYDYQCGAKAISRHAWETTRDHLQEEGFGWDVELLAVSDALGIPIAEVPLEWYDADGSTVSTVGTSLDLARAVVRARRNAARLRRRPLGGAATSGAATSQR